MMSPEELFAALPEAHKLPFIKLRNVIKEHLPTGFSERITPQMLHYEVPHFIYPKGYHCNPNLPLPFVSLASQKNFIALYHMGLYVNPQLQEWFIQEYPLHGSNKLDMGKSCIRFRKTDQIPFELIGNLCSKIKPEAWVELYEKNILKSRA